MNILKKLFDHDYKELKKFNALADKIVALDSDYQKLTDDELARVPFGIDTILLSIVVNVV